MTAGLPESIGTSKRGARTVGCILLFLLPVFGSGAAAIGLAIRNAMHRGAPATWSFPLALGIVFITAGVLLARRSVSSLRTTATHGVLQLAHPDEPWLWRRDWSAGVIDDELARQSTAISWFAAIWNLVSVPVLFGVRRQVSTSNVAFVVLCTFPLIGGLLLVVAAYCALRRQKFGTSRCRLAHVPGVAGGELAGEIETRFLNLPSEGVVLHLMCVRRRVTGDGRNTSTVESVITRDDLQVPAAALLRSATGTLIPFRFAIPPDAPATDDHDPHDVTAWRLTASAEVPGIDFAAQFEVPVFHVAGEAPVATHTFDEPDDALAIQPLDAGSGIAVTTGADGTVTITIPPRPRARDVVGLLIAGVIWFGVVAMMVVQRAPLVLPIAFGAFGIIIVYGLVDTIAGRSQVRLAEQKLIVRHDWFRLGSSRAIDAGDIESIRANLVPAPPGASPRYSIDIALREGDRVQVAGAIEDRRDAERVAARLRLHVGAKTAAF